MKTGRQVLALRGPNLWANFPVLEAWIDLAEYADCSSDEVPGFNDRLMSWLPTITSVGTRTVSRVASPSRLGAGAPPPAGGPTPAARYQLSPPVNAPGRDHESR